MLLVSRERTPGDAKLLYSTNTKTMYVARAIVSFTDTTRRKRYF